MTHILVVEDEELIAESLELFLKHEGFKCSVLNSAVNVTQVSKKLGISAKI